VGPACAQVELLASLRSTKVVRFVAAAFGSDKLGVVMEYCARGSLHDLLDAYRKPAASPLPWTRRIQMALDIAIGMHHLVRPPRLSCRVHAGTHLSLSHTHARTHSYIHMHTHSLTHSLTYSQRPETPKLPLDTHSLTHSCSSPSPRTNQNRVPPQLPGCCQRYIHVAGRGCGRQHSNDPPIIHRDLKSPNVLINSTWDAKVRVLHGLRVSACALCCTCCGCSR
jgi:serine/threonine protein kinase